MRDRYNTKKHIPKRTVYHGESAGRVRGTVRPVRNYSAYRGGVESRWLRRGLYLLAALCAAGAICFIALLAVVRLGDCDRVQGEPKLMIILGCQVKPWGPSILLQDRLDKALAWLDEHPDTVVVCSGGQGADEHISEAQCMRDYLVEHGCPEEQIIMEDGSFNTDENIAFSRQALSEAGHDPTDGIVVVSNGFHLARVRMIWERRSGGQELSTLAAPSSHVPSRMKMYLREPLALAKSFLFDGKGELLRTRN